MIELNEPFPLQDRFRDSRDTLRERTALLRRRRGVRSAANLAIISQMRADAHNTANLFRDFYVGTTETGTEELRDELTSAESALARWALMQTHEEFRTVDLARIDNLGDWEATAEVEADIAQIGETLRAEDDGGNIIDRHAPEARRRITVDPTLVTAGGLVAVRRKRLMLATAPSEVHFRDIRSTNGRVPSDEEMVAMSHIEIDKVSEFVLDLGVLSRMHPRAAQEVMEAATGVAPAEITNHGRSLVSPRLIEAAIDVRHEMLTPAVTTYYADRKFKDIRPADSGQRQSELTSA